MRPRYAITIVIIFSILAFARGDVFRYQMSDFFNVLQAHADGDGGDGGSGGGDAGVGAGGSGGGDAGSGAGDSGGAGAGDGGSGGGDAGTGTASGGGDAGTGTASGDSDGGSGGGDAGAGTASGGGDAGIGTASGGGDAGAGTASGGGDAGVGAASGGGDAGTGVASGGGDAGTGVAVGDIGGPDGAGDAGIADAAPSHGAAIGPAPSAPSVSVSSLAVAGEQPLAFVYLSQIPYTGLDLGPIGTVLYWAVLIGGTLALAYFILFTVAPYVNRNISAFFGSVSAALSAMPAAPLADIAVTLAAVPVGTSTAVAGEEQNMDMQSFEEPMPEATRGYSPYEGFKSFAREGTLSIDDIVKGLTRTEPAMKVVHDTNPEHESAGARRAPAEPARAPAQEAPASVRGFAVALVEGDRAAVFAGLRQHVRGSGTPEELLSAAVCLLDDAYRARIDGTAVDPEIARLTGRLPTPALEQLIASLTTAIDSSYSSGITGAKLALIRALAVLEKA